MAVESTAELLDFVKHESGLPGTNNEMDDPKWYRNLTLAQKDLFQVLASHVPQVLSSGPVKLTTSDGGYTYDFASFPWGRVVLRESRTGQLLYPGPEWDRNNTDFVIEGDKIRWTDNQQRTFSDGPYAWYISAPGDIDADTEPTIKPAEARILIGWRALELWARRGRMRDPAPYSEEWTKGLWGEPGTGEAGLIAALKTQFQFQGGFDGDRGYNHWTHGIDIGTGRFIG